MRGTCTTSKKKKKKEEKCVLWLLDQYGVGRGQSYAKSFVFCLFCFVLIYYLLF